MIICVQHLMQRGEAAPKSLREFPKTLRHLAVVVVQDALELALDFPVNAVHAYLLENEEFKALLAWYKEPESQQVICTPYILEVILLKNVDVFITLRSFL